MKQTIVNIITNKLFQSEPLNTRGNRAFLEDVMACAEEILKSEPFRRIRRTLEEIDSIIDCTCDHDEDGERVDEHGEHSAADIVEMLLNAEQNVEEAIEIVGPSEPLACDVVETEETMTCDLCGTVELEHDAIESGWIPSYWRGETEIPNPVCRECATARTKCLDGESVLIEEPTKHPGPHYFGFRINGEIGVFSSPVIDEEFQEATKNGLPEHWVAWHLEPGETFPKSERVAAIRKLPIIVELSGSLGLLKHDGGGLIQSPYPVADWRTWMTKHFAKSGESVLIEEPATLNKFTVIGYYDETGERYNGHHEGESWTDAVNKSIAEAGLDLVVVEVLAGHHKGLAESQSVEHACDWPTGNETE